MFFFVKLKTPKSHSEIRMKWKMPKEDSNTVCVSEFFRICRRSSRLYYLTGLLPRKEVDCIGLRRPHSLRRIPPAHHCPPRPRRCQGRRWWRRRCRRIWIFERPKFHNRPLFFMQGINVIFLINLVNYKKNLNNKWVFDSKNFIFLLIYFRILSCI